MRDFLNLRKFLQRTVIMLLFSVMPFFISAQKMSFFKADSLTYALYTGGQWDSLIVAGKQAIADGHDYYYMRARIGMAYFNKNKFRLAARELEKAVAFNSSDTFTLRRLYLSYLYSAREADAWMLTKKFNAEMKAASGLDSKIFISGIYAEGGYVFSNCLKENSSIDLDNRPNIYGESDLTGGYSYVHLGLKHPVTKYLSIFHAYTNLSINKEKIMQHLDTVRKEDFYMLQQNQYYINATFDLKRKWLITPAFHYLSVRYRPLSAQFDTINGYTYIQSQQEFNDYVGFLGISKDYGHSAFGISGSYSKLNEKTYIQGNAILSLYPLGNMDIYSTTTISGISERGKGSQVKGSGNKPDPPRLIISETIGARLFRKLYAEGNYTYGDISGYNEKNAYLVNNFPDHTAFRAGASMIYSLSPHIDLGIYYLYTEKSGSYFYYRDLLNNVNSIITADYKYQINTITGGVKWKL